MENPEVNVVEEAPVRKKSGSRIWIFVLGFCCCVLVGVGVGVVASNIMQNNDDTNIDSEQIVEGAMEDIVPMSVEESIDYLDEKIREYKNTDVASRLVIMEMNVYMNAGRPEDVIGLVGGIEEEDLDIDEKMQYYMVLNKAYRALGDNETANYYRDNYFVLYDELYDGGGGGDE